jgi:hypothetical protein
MGAAALESGRGGEVLAGSERNPESAIQGQKKKTEFSRISK